MPDPLGIVGNVASTTDSQAVRRSAMGDGPGNDTGFKDLLMANIQHVNELQQDAEMAIEDLVAGRRDDVAGVMIAKQKADTAFKMLLQVRNKMLEAYDEIKQMRV